MAGGSPAVVHHHAGKLNAKDCEAEEIFYLNRSARKVSVLLSWQQSQHGNLTFWLRAPDGTLLNLYREMKQFESYCLATVYLPKQQDGKVVPHDGQWRMIIRGETQGTYMDYHALVIAEDHELKYHVDFPRKVYKVGDVLPIQVKLAVMEKPLTDVSDVLMEVSQLPQALEELVAKYQIPSVKPTKSRPAVPQQDPLLQKLRTMEFDPALRERLKPVRTLLSLKQKSLEYKASGPEIVVPYTLKQTGLCSFKIAVHYETSKTGPIHRIDFVSVHVV
jgi:hypothetical protein